MRRSIKKAQKVRNRNVKIRSKDKKSWMITGGSMNYSKFIVTSFCLSVILIALIYFSAFGYQDTCYEDICLIEEIYEYDEPNYRQHMPSHITYTYDNRRYYDCTKQSLSKYRDMVGSEVECTVTVRTYFGLYDSIHHVTLN